MFVVVNVLKKFQIAYSYRHQLKWNINFIRPPFCCSIFWKKKMFNETILSEGLLQNKISIPYIKQW